MSTIMANLWIMLLVGLLNSVGAPVDPQTGIPDLMARIEGPQTPNRQGYDSFSLQGIMEKTRVPGVSVAVIRDFEIHWAKGYGIADLKTNAPVTTDTLFQAASISKPVMAMAFLRSVQEGKVALDEDANRYLKSWKIPSNEYTRSQPVTPRALLSHTSGTGDGFGFPGYEPDQPRPTLIQILNGEKPSNVGPVFWERPPFTAFKYSGGGMTIVQLLLMDVLQKPFAEIMREYVLDPVGMARSTYEQPLPPDLDSGAARAHAGGNRVSEVKWHVYPEQAAAGLWTTPSDLARFAIEVQKAVRGDSGRVLSRTLAREMVTPVGVGNYAVGFSLEKRGEGWYFMHSGGNWGFSCNLIAHVRKGYGLAVMTNSDNGGVVIREIEARVAAAYDWDSLDKPVPR
jgi:CubicO group peptidase (beta-lactamase class C family)